MASQPKTCRECSAPIYSRNRTGYCRTHVRSAPEVRQRVADGVRSSFQRNPEQREIKRRAARIAANRPGERERRSKQAKERGLHKIGKAAWTAESLAKLGRSISNHRLAWCPPHLRDEYRHLTKTKGIKAAEARQMIEDLHEAEMQRWRREHGLVVDEPPRAKPGRKPAMGNDKEFLEAVLPYVAEVTGISVETINGPAKAGHILRARFVAILAIRRRFGTGISFDAIGAMIGGRDHSTIQHAYKRALQFEKDDPEFAALVAEVLAA